MKSDPTAEFDSRFSDPEAGPTPWRDAAQVLEQRRAVLADHRARRRPAARDAADRRRRGRRRALLHRAARAEGPQPRARMQVALTTGNNSWAQGLDVVVEGAAVRVTDHDDAAADRRRLRGEVRQRLALRRRRRRFGAGEDARRRVPDRAGQGAGVREGAARADEVPVPLTSGNCGGSPQVGSRDGDDGRLRRARPGRRVHGPQVEEGAARGRGRARALRRLAATGLRATAPLRRHPARGRTRGRGDRRRRRRPAGCGCS